MKTLYEPIFRCDLSQLLAQSTEFRTLAVLVSTA
jgi:hypothetical protein